MGKWLYRKQEPSHIQGICVRCETNVQKKVGGKNKYRPLCSTCDDLLYRSAEGKQKDKIKIKTYVKELKRPYRKHVKSFCEECGFIPKHMCQLDVDHIDGNHQNNNIDNLQTLCANCHRLKTYFNKDWELK